MYFSSLRMIEDNSLVVKSLILQSSMMIFSISSLFDVLFPILLIRKSNLSGISTWGDKPPAWGDKDFTWGDKPSALVDKPFALVDKPFAWVNKDSALVDKSSAMVGKNEINDLPAI